MARVRVRHWRLAGLLVGFGAAAVSLVAWLFVPQGWFLEPADQFDPYDYVAAWVSLGFALGAVAATGLGVVATMKLVSMSEDRTGGGKVGRVVDLFIPLLVAGLAIAAQIDTWRGR